jgi:hypothetical protein
VAHQLQNTDLEKDYVARQESACLMSQDMYEDYDYQIYLVSSDEATFHVSGVCEQAQLMCVGFQQSPCCYRAWKSKCQVNAQCAIACGVTGTFFFPEDTKTPSPVPLTLICWNCMKSHKLRNWLHWSYSNKLEHCHIGDLLI